ncbi:MAG: polyprenyl synthetase family protein [Chloroflexi bacterium]|nr:polyprenyl synthetase family protein [Chloroflexota bacterium]
MREKALDFLTPYTRLVEEEMQSILQTPPGELMPLYGMLQYHLGWVGPDFKDRISTTGKRLRPGLCLLACEAAGGDVNLAVPAAAAVELVHNFSLVHDDIEDRSPLRRSREAIWKLWGDALAINAGDALFTLAHLALQRLSQRGGSPSKVAESLAVFDGACLTLTEGQYLDLKYQKNTGVTTEMYLDMASKKTASLLAASAQLGAMLAAAEPRVVETFRLFGSALGMGFQIRDDILGIWGDPGKTGKGVGEDIFARKKSLPVVYALQEEKKQNKNDLSKMYAQPELGQEDVRAITSLLENYGAAEYADRLAQRFVDQALQALASLGLQNPAEEKLRRLASFLAERSR